MGSVVYGGGLYFRVDAMLVLDGIVVLLLLPLPLLLPACWCRAALSFESAASSLGVAEDDLRRSGKLA